MEKFGFAIIGAGRWGSIHAKVYTEDPRVKLISICDLDEEKARKLARFAFQSIRHFIDCVIEDKEPISSGKDGLEVTKVICAMEESILRGNPVEIR